MNKKKLTTRRERGLHRRDMETAVLLLTILEALISAEILLPATLSISSSDLFNTAAFVLYAAVYLFLLNIYRAQDVTPRTMVYAISTRLVSWFFTFFVFFIAVTLHRGCIVIPNTPLFAIGIPAIQIAVSVLFAYVTTKLINKVYLPRQSILAYKGDTAPEEIDKEVFEKSVNHVYKIDAILPAQYVIDNAASIAADDSIDSIVMYELNGDTRECITNAYYNTTVRIASVPKVMELAEYLRAPSRYSHSLIFDDTRRIRSGYKLAKRAFDIVSSGIVIILTSPIMLVTALLVKKDGGPALYKQTRLTVGGREFQLYKFRSMIVDAEKDTGAVLSGGEGDSRITKVGKVIRACRIDELPQLFNIFKGDMSVVGPRPERPELQKQIEETLPEFKFRLWVKAGLTGRAQVYGRYNTPPKEKLKMDLSYIAESSFMEDLRLSFATISILLSRESTEGNASMDEWLGKEDVIEENHPADSADN